MQRNAILKSNLFEYFSFKVCVTLPLENRIPALETSVNELDFRLFLSFPMLLDNK